ncbi:CRISPR-associated protein Cmr2 [Haloactinospora alba]|uniref:CRISPR-associated protein Cmr2 n=1 Tax=Haloactinospora alba TaxID=405555 RepID=A0A543N9Z7_9ACTN|nr:type III-B CRISPR-associated protein Cas10/Cmr2 [Haloactinospora alba]TQN28628.1 CRISPR-associated protein Cmr2 [Haloactinospora alba]
MDERDLVLLNLSGVQRFITESRTTADLYSGSRIVMSLAGKAAEEFRGSPRNELIFPSPPSDGSPVVMDGMSNRVVALVPAGEGASIAAAAAHSTDQLWRAWVREVFGERELGSVPEWPRLSWVCVPPQPGGYPRQWEIAQQRLAGRKNVNDFSPFQAKRQGVCALSPHWPASPHMPRHRTVEADQLSVPNWVKRCWPRLEGGKLGFPPTNAFSSSRFRAEVLRRWDDSRVREAVRELRDAARKVDPDPSNDTPVPGIPEPDTDQGRTAGTWLRSQAGIWVYPETWHLHGLRRKHGEKHGNPLDDGFTDAVQQGRAAAAHLTELLGHHRKGGSGETLPPSPPCAYLAVLVQDLDSMGRYLSGHPLDPSMDRPQVSAAQHRLVSQRLQALAARQRAAVEDPDVRGRVVYAGGDDLLALLPADTALHAARRCHDEVPGDLPTPSTALLFFHHAVPLQLALRRAREGLTAAKDARELKHGLSVEYLRSSSASDRHVGRWEDGPTSSLEVFLPRAGERPMELSPTLVHELERSAGQLHGLLRSGEPHAGSTARREIRRLIERHVYSDGTAGAEHVRQFASEADEALWNLREARGRDEVPVRAARIAVFLKQEVR